MFNKIFWSVVLIILGLSLLANNFDIPLLKDLWKLWPLIFVYIGLKLI
ncbi:MAG: LiaI-LiaF-like domain-containing protein, partial [Dictyoglomus turgidum]